MKVKQRPEDFKVDELTDVVPGKDGPFALYRLEKRGWTTPDALAVVRRRWQIEPRRLSYGGLKDRHALTVQFLTIFHGPRRALAQQGITLTYLGQVAEPYTSEQIRANRFRLTLRALTDEEAERARATLDDIRRDGLANYFDDQRFGSVRPGRAFVAERLVRGQFEEALKLALAEPYEHERAAERQEKDLLRAHWGDWATLRERLPRGHARSLVDYLHHHPGDFRGAVIRLRPELRGLYLSAYQSHLWNRMLARYLERTLRPEQIVRVPLKMGELPMPRGLDEAQRGALTALSLPLPSARLKLPDEGPRRELVESVLADEGLELPQMQVKGVRELFFSRGERAALCQPSAVQAQAAADDLNPGRRKLLLSFELPRGSYATLLVKRLQVAGPDPGNGS